MPSVAVNTTTSAITMRFSMVLPLPRPELERRTQTSNDTVLGAMAEHTLAYLNAEFLESEDARPIRMLAEYFEPLRRFKAQNIQDTVVFFGSARIRSREHADEALAGSRAQLLRKTRRAGSAAGRTTAARPTRAQRVALSRARRGVTCRATTRTRASWRSC